MIGLWAYSNTLSVSRPYLALDEIYRPIRAAFPNNPSRRQRLVVRQGPGTTGLSPSPAPLSRGLGPGPPLRTLLQTTIRTARATDFQAGLFPVRSPLLRESSVGWGQRYVTPRQRCPRPNGLGRNLRSKTRWFTGFCNSHQVSHFATLFIDARAEIFVAESRFVYSRQSGHVSAAHAPRTGVRQQTTTFSFRFLGVIHVGGCSFCHGDTGSHVTGSGRGRGAMMRPHPIPLMFDNTFTGRSARQVQWTSREVAGSEPPTSPRSEHFTEPFNRQIAPPTKNGHAPTPIESRKSSQSVNPYYVWTCNNAGGTTRQINARSASPAVGTSRPVLTVRRTGRPAPRATGKARVDLLSNKCIPSRSRDKHMTTGRINQVALLRDVRLAWSSTHYLGRGEAITRRGHRSCRGTKCTGYERTGPRPYAHEIFRIRKHDRASMHRCSRIMSIDTLGTPGTTEVHQAATRSLDGQGMAIHPKFHRFSSMHEARSLPTHTTISPLTCPLRTSSRIHTNRSTTHTTDRFGRGPEETMSEGTPQPLGTIKSEKHVNPQISRRKGNR
ncbi:hypothetical protein V6N11_056289 [Hibiscus sabdariffa]|uniref:Uncharacterized protein n=1 Tax=Hibiscus sabdariffa TaxID=183260 RepID=A0ABR2T466_9ROSI